MPITLSSNIEDQIAAAETAVVDLIEVDFGDSLFKYWSTQAVSSSWFPTQAFASGLQPSSFTACIVEIGSRTWELGPENSSFFLTIARESAEIDKLLDDYGTEIFQGAHIINWRLFPNVKEIVQMWSGFSLMPETFEEDIVEWPVQIGPMNLLRRFGRKIQRFCPHRFRLSADCPIDEHNAIGMPNLSEGFQFTAAAGTNDSLVIMPGDFTASVFGDWIVIDKANNIYGTVTTVVLNGGNTELGIINKVLGEDGSGSFGPSDKLWVAPKHRFCGKSVQDCKDRGMFGVHDQDHNGVGNKRRYFGGMSDIVNVKFRGKVPDGDKNPFVRNSQGNSSLAGDVVPVVFGSYQLTDRESIGWASAGRFQHGLWLLCEGEIYQVENADIGGHPADNVTVDKTNIYDIVQNSSLAYWGTWYSGGAVDFDSGSPVSGGVEDSRATTIKLANEVRGAVGRRRSVLRRSNLIIDNYGFGVGANRRGENIPAGWPYLFNSAYGEGVSPDGWVWSRVRIDTGEDDQGALRGTFKIVGLMCALPSNFTETLQPFESRFNLVIGGTTLRYTTQPNNAIAAYNILVGERWGGGFKEAQLNLPSIKTLSDFHEGLVTTSNSSSGIISGSLALGPGDTTNAGLASWVAINDIPVQDKDLIGKQITITMFGSYVVTRIIVNVDHNIPPFEANLERSLLGIAKVPKSITAALPKNQDLIVLYVDLPFTDPDLPRAGDTYEIAAGVAGGGGVRRWSANGALSDDRPLGDVVASVLEESASNYRLDAEGKIEFVTRRALTDAEIDDVLANRLFTDRGVNRNILREDSGKTTLKVKIKNELEIANEYNLRFFDSADGFRETQIQVVNEEAQRRAAKLTGQEGDIRILSKTFDASLITSLDQAARRLALAAREEFLQNLYVTFQTSLRTAMPILPGDYIAIDSVKLRGFRPFIDIEDFLPSSLLLFRVLRREETSSYVNTLECQIHINGIYNDSIRAFTDIFKTPPSDGGTNVAPPNVTPEDPVEEIEIANDGTVEDYIRVKVTYPQLEQ